MDLLTTPAGLFSDSISNTQTVPIHNNNNVISDDHYNTLLQTHMVSSLSKTRKNTKKNTRQTKKSQRDFK